VDHEAALWLRLELAEGVATVPRGSILANTLAGGGGWCTGDRLSVAGHCGALAEQCLAQVPVVSGEGW
jgi:hypothetical protein